MTTIVVVTEPGQNRAGASRVALHLALIAVFVLAGCVQNGRKPESVTLCDSSGCSEQPSDVSRYDPDSAVPDEDPDGRIAALEELAVENPAAAYDLALRFFRGDGIRQDSYQALQWMRDAAERGDLEAQKAVGRLYLTGLEEMGPDPREAQKWLGIAAGRGDAESGELLKQAEAARRSEELNYRWRSEWRPRFYRYWYHDYPYRWRWRGGNWGYYY